MAGNASDTGRLMTIGYKDRSIVFSPPSVWVLSNQGQGTTGATVALSNTENATAVFQFPQNATAFFWRGFLRSGPALYSLCIDCTDPSEANVVDGHAWQKQPTDVVTTLFSKTDLMNSSHTVTITNLLDPRFGAVSQITIQSFVIVTSDTGSSSSVASASSSSGLTQTITSTSMSAATSSVATSMSGGTSPSAAAYWSKPKGTGTLSKGAVVGTVFACAGGVLAVLALGLWLLRKKHAYWALSSTPYKEKKVTPDPESPMSKTLKLAPSNEEDASMVQFNVPSRKHLDCSISQPPPPTSHHKRSSRHYSRHNRNQNPSPNYPPNQEIAHPSRPQWGIIPVRFSPTTPETAYEEEVITDSDWDFTTPLPSSEIGTSSFIMTDPTLFSVAGHDDQMENRIPKTSPESPSSIRMGSHTGHMQSISQGWRRLDEFEDSQALSRTMDSM